MLASTIANAGKILVFTVIESSFLGGPTVGLELIA
jgi:hypothetical protein